MCSKQNCHMGLDVRINKRTKRMIHGFVDLYFPECSCRTKTNIVHHFSITHAFRPERSKLVNYTWEETTLSGCRA